MNFKVGEIYKDRTGKEYRFLVYCSEADPVEQTIFFETVAKQVVTRYENGSSYAKANDLSDIIPPEKKTVKLYPALYKSDGGQKYYTEYLHEICPEDAIRLLTEYPAVVVEVDDE